MSDGSCGSPTLRVGERSMSAAVIVIVVVIVVFLSSGLSICSNSTRALYFSLLLFVLAARFTIFVVLRQSTVGALNIFIFSFIHPQYSARRNLLTTGPRIISDSFSEPRQRRLFSSLAVVTRTSIVHSVYCKLRPKSA